MVMTVQDYVVTKDLERRTIELREKLGFQYTDEQLDAAAKALGCRSAAELRTIALHTQAWECICCKSRWN